MNEVRWRTHLNEGVAHLVDDGHIDEFRTGVRCDHDRIAAFDCIDTLDDGRCLGIRRGGQGANNANRLTNLDDVALEVLFDDTH